MSLLRFLFHSKNRKWVVFFALSLVVMFIWASQPTWDDFPSSSAIPARRSDSIEVNLDDYKKQLAKTNSKLLFVGDDVISSLSSIALAEDELPDEFDLMNPVFLGVEGDLTQNILWRLQNSKLQSCPQLVVVYAGTSNLLSGEEPVAVVDGVVEIIRSLRAKIPKSKIVLVYPLPLGKHADSEIRKKISSHNQLLQKFIFSPYNHFYTPALIQVNFGNSFLDDSGGFLEEASEDGITLTDTGLQMFINELHPVLQQHLTNHERNSSEEIKDKLQKAYRKPIPAITSKERTKNLPPPFERLFYINMEKNKWRADLVTGEFEKFDIVPERFPAIDAQYLSLDLIDLTPRTRHFFLKRQVHEDLPTIGALGCSFSHIALWQTIVDQDISFALIFEDDLFLKDDFEERLTEIGQIFKESNSGPNASCNSVDIMLLHHSSLRGNTIPSKYPGIAKMTGEFFGTQAYAITNFGAKMLLRNVFPIEGQIDGYIGTQAASDPRLSLYGVENSLCVQKSYSMSDIQDSFKPSTTCPSNTSTYVLMILFCIGISFAIRDKDRIYLLFRRFVLRWQ